MNAVKINGYIGKDGLKIGIDKLKMFKNRNVEVIIYLQGSVCRLGAGDIDVC
jgi:hypothetical protein